MTPTWFEHATFWSGVRRATVAHEVTALLCRFVCVYVCVHTFQCLNRLQVGVLHWHNRSTRGTPAEQCQGCEFAPHLEQSSILPKLLTAFHRSVCDPHKWSQFWECRWPWRDLTRNLLIWSQTRYRCATRSLCHVRIHHQNTTSCTYWSVGDLLWVCMHVHT